VTAGWTLRIMAPKAFMLHWTDNAWQSSKDTRAQSTAIGSYYVDLPVPAEQQAPFQFTFLWTENQHWEGRDYTVSVDQAR
jgi:glucoamylase